ADVGDPANAGALLRSAEAFGAASVAFGDRGVDAYHPKVVRASMGALFRLRVGRIDPAALDEAARNGFHVAGLSAGGEDVRRSAWPPRAALVVGNERHGLGRWEQACRQFLGIPMAAATESLNAAIAGSIALYEAARKRSETALPDPCQDSV
ncbi:MAG TPA: RNA methyltransferase, partial [Candidatus Tumulicola sp.]|nr:RNA methyltransferase [Candidatus Tumulicola sp.]